MQDQQASLSLREPLDKSLVAMWRGDPIVESKELRLSLTVFGKITVPLGTYELCSEIPTWLRCLSGIHILSLTQREKLVVSHRKWQDSCTSLPRHLTPPGCSRNEDMSEPS